MSKKTKIIVGLGAAVVVVGALTAAIRGRDKDLPRVTTAKVEKVESTDEKPTGEFKDFNRR